MKRVFADTYYFIALLNPSDRAHARTVEYISNNSLHLVTTDWVITELGDAMAKSPEGRGQFLVTRSNLMADPDVSIVSFDETIFEAGIRLNGQRVDKKWSLTDCISFVVMQEPGLNEALTGDRDFEQAGFVALLK